MFNERVENTSCRKGGSKRCRFGYPRSSIPRTEPVELVPKTTVDFLLFLHK